MGAGVCAWTVAGRAAQVGGANGRPPRRGRQPAGPGPLCDDEPVGSGACAGPAGLADARDDRAGGVDCRPLAFVLTAGQAGDAPAFPDVMARLRVPRRRGRPRTRPDVVLADRAYSSRAIRDHLRKRGIRAVIPVPADQRSHRLRRGSRGGRPPAFDREAYKKRNTVERCINRLKQWRGIATRYVKTATIYLAGLHIAGIFLWSGRRSNETA